MNLLQLQTFRAVMTTGTFTLAGRMIGRSQSSVTRLIDNLEVSIGTSLFERRKGKVTPTDAAFDLLDEVENILSALNRIQDMPRRRDPNKSKLVRVGVNPALATSFFPGVLAKLSESHPSIKVTLDVRFSLTVEERAATDQIDVGFAEGQMVKKGFSAEEFTNVPYQAVVPKSFQASECEYITPTQLQEVPVISWSSFTAANQLLNSAFDEFETGLHAPYKTTLAVAALSLAERGLGVAIIDPVTIAMHPPRNSVVLPFRPEIPFQTFILLPDGRRASKATEALMATARIQLSKTLVGLESELGRPL